MKRPSVGSGSRRIRATALSPPTLRRASISSATVADTPGSVSARRSPRRARSSPAAWSRKPIAAEGLANQWRTVSGTGRIAGWPASGSRMMPEKNPLAAALGLPGRTTMVGSRIDTPSISPRRDQSLTSASPISFCVP